MKIKLNRGMFAEIDREDLNKVNKHTWHVKISRNTCYAVSKNNKTKNIRMHRLIMGVLKNKTKIIDHIDGNGLNNKKNNLRMCTVSQNMRNLHLAIPNSSGCRWVHRENRRNAWVVRVFGKHVKQFKNKKEAIKVAHEINEKKYGGKFDLSFKQRQLKIGKPSLTYILSGKENAKFVHKVNFFPTKPWCLKMTKINVREFFRTKQEAILERNKILEEVKLSNNFI